MIKGGDLLKRVHINVGKFPHMQLPSFLSHADGAEVFNKGIDDIPCLSPFFCARTQFQAKIWSSSSSSVERMKPLIQAPYSPKSQPWKGDPSSSPCAVNPTQQQGTQVEAPLHFASLLLHLSVLRSHVKNKQQ